MILVIVVVVVGIDDIVVVIHVDDIAVEHCAIDRVVGVVDVIVTIAHYCC